MRNSLCVLMALAVASTAAPAALAQAPAPAASVAAQPEAVVAQVRKILAERYVLPAKRPALDAVLSQGLASGRYRVSDPAQLAQLIDADLARVGQDGHLNFRFDPAGAAVLATRRSPQPDQAAYAQQVRDLAHGVTQLRVLPGNVRYMEYTGFHWLEGETATALAPAMAFLAGGDAVIIDLRRNGGGAPDAVQYIISHFMEAGRPLMTFYMNGDEASERTAAIAVPAGSRMVGKPLYVLISGGSASAAEEFAGHMAGYRLGELVGERTAGAGFRNDVLPLDGGYVLSVSVGRAVLAATNRDWEGVGHAPTLPVPAPDALEAAHAAALRRVAAAATGAEAEGRRASLSAIAQAAEAQRNHAAPARPLEVYTGTYGIRTIGVRDGRLYQQRERRYPEPLIALGGDLFALQNDPTTRVRFETAGDRATAFSLETATGASRGRFERDR